MGILLTMYKTLLQRRNLPFETYRTEKLKWRLVDHYGDKIVFQVQFDRTKPELIYNSDISVSDAINAVASAKSSTLPNTQVLGSSSLSKSSIIFHAASVIRGDLKGIKNVSLNDSEITEEKAVELIPDSLFSFLKWIFEGSTEETSAITLDKSLSDSKSTNRKITSIAQDLIFAVSNGRQPTPKHIGLAVAIKHLTGSKALTEILNHLQHCIGYHGLLRIDTSIANTIIQNATEDGVIIPSNIISGTFVQAAADNNDLTDSTLDGKNTTHGTTMVLYQKAVLPGEGEFGVVQRGTFQLNTKQRSRKLADIPLIHHQILDFSSHGKKPTAIFNGDITKEWFHQSSETVNEAKALDACWLFLRLCPRKVFELNLSRDPNLQKVTGWSGFNAHLHLKNNDVSVIGYCPMLPANSVEYSTIYTVMTILQKQMERLSQENSVITFEENIYAKAKEIQWRRPDEFKKLIIRMGGFHIALNFLSVIRKRYSESGFEDILIEADLYGNNTDAKIIKGKSYNRGVRAHKLMLEALLHLKWEAFCQWVAQEREQINTTSVDEALRECNLVIEKENMHLLGDMLLNMCKEIEVFKDPFNRFCEESEVKSKTFQFWNEYTKMVGTLLRYIRAERVGNWDLHLASVVEMIPYMFAYDHTNYARWMSVYLCDMRLLPSSAPSVQMEFEGGSHSVNRSANSFNMVWTDMTLEQSENRDTKTLGGIVGFSTNPGAVNRWFLQPMFVHQSLEV